MVIRSTTTADGTALTTTARRAIAAIASRHARSVGRHVGAAAGQHQYAPIESARDA
jgi:hypothetical protein